MIGGGARASYFNQMIADRTGKEVLTGSTEGTAVGNIVVQLIAMGQLKGTEEAHHVIEEFLQLESYYSQKN
ncbi:carbohydrate kinase FGGY [Streptococcus pneumoniae]|nr:carbohydrate kinase FGGY [Streptococcus pneumoniae]CAG6336252.1 carbohydrate kinase FGGY [Streptococcus pneumoniae]